MINQDKVYILTYSPDRGYDEITTDIIGVFATKELAKKVLMEQKGNSYINHFNPEDYDIEVYRIES